MDDESADLLKTILWTLDIIRSNNRAVVRRIAETYAEAQRLVATIPKEDGSARPRIVACFARWSVYRDKDDLAGTGWILTAVQERIAEGDLPDSAAMKILVDQAVAMLPSPKPHLH